MMRMRRFSAVMVGQHRGFQLSGGEVETGRPIDVATRVFIQPKRDRRALGVGGREGKSDRGDERRGGLVMARREFATMRFDDGAGAVEPEPVVPLAQGAERLVAPVFGRTRKVLLRL